MDALLSVNWDEIFGYVVHDYCFASLFCAGALITLAFATKMASSRTKRKSY